MRRLGHQPTLYSHPENDDDDEELNDNDNRLGVSHWDVRPATYAPPQSHRSSSNHLVKQRPYPPHHLNQRPTTQHPHYTDIYSQFVKRYRSSHQEFEDPRNDPDSHFYQKGLAQLGDVGDLSDEEHDRPGQTDFHNDPRSSFDTEHTHGLTRNQQDRLEWGLMLSSVLSGDVLKSERARIQGALESAGHEKNNAKSNIWIGLRAKFHGRTDDEERKQLEERRHREVNPIIQGVFNFRVSEQAATKGNIALALQEVTTILRRLEVAQSLYPSLRAFYSDKPAAASSNFLARCDTLNTWSTVLNSLRKQIAVLKRWTNSDSLDVTQPFTNPEVPIIGSARASSSSESADSSTFVERILKEESMQRTFEKGFLGSIYTFIGAARDAQVNLSSLFKDMNLPTFENELVPLISFPTKLAQAALRLRLDYVRKLRDPDVLIVDQMTEDLKVSIGLACTLKRQYEGFLAPDPGGNWNLPQCIGEDYDATILEALSEFFKLIHWKLKSGAKGIYFKETEVLEAQWATFNDVSLSTSGGSRVVSEQLCSLTYKLMVRITNYFDTQVRVPAGGDIIQHIQSQRQRQPEKDKAGNVKAIQLQASASGSRKMTPEQIISWYGKVLESVRLRHRKIQRFARMLTQKFSNSAEFNMENVPLDKFMARLASTDHFLVHTQCLEEDGVYVIASGSLIDRLDYVRRVLTEAFHVEEFVNEEDGNRGLRPTSLGDGDDAHYLLIIAPGTHFLWSGRIVIFPMPKVELEMKEDRLRLVADGSQRRLSMAKQAFMEAFQEFDGNANVGFIMDMPPCIVEQQSHLPNVGRELRKIARATNRLAESIVDSVNHVRGLVKDAHDYQELLENWYVFASEHGQHAQRYMDSAALGKFTRLLTKLAISWVSFICDDCNPADRRTFRWAVNALEFTEARIKNNILQLPEEQFKMLRIKVATCMSLLVGHFDILGAKSSLEASKLKEQQEETLQQALPSGKDEEDESTKALSASSDDPFAFTDATIRLFWEKLKAPLKEVDERRAVVGLQHRTMGRVLDNEKPEDRSLVFLASSSSNISIRWQQGRFIGAGAFGSVYLAVNLDTGSLMAVKEIKFQELSGLPNLYTQIKDELSVMEMLHHPNVVEYYGIEVHRDRVYIFEEYCQGGSLAALLEHGRIEDEGIIQVYTMQMLEGLAYLHSKGIVHRDVKPDNILLDHSGVIKFVDFGAAKILAKNQRSIQRSRRTSESYVGSNMSSFGGLGMNNSLTGTPMYMSPEVIKNDKRGRHGAMDIWSLGCVVLEFATGKKPWSNLDNEWAIMFHIGVATQHPPLPEPGQLSDLGITFIKSCLTIDPLVRPSASELMGHPWMVQFRETLLRYEENEMATSPPANLTSETNFEGASVAKVAVMEQAEEANQIKQQSPPTPSSLSSDSSDSGV
ncbi:hypothetical protein BDN72DRAFT_783175 [Pluteus cervinus]|uniref:Uncharacterized protein n=1 Tax=Pluteus cervinus TaxID=181527 RepID=A0ACD3BFD5_9AGAR|nr:hypothetical protein BDN72DRAFT_783175 [Pluteus cervinus]